MRRSETLRCFSIWRATQLRKMNTKRARYPAEMWAEARTAYAAGLTLRGIADKFGMPAGTMLARAKREGWTREIEKAKAIMPQQSSAIIPGNAMASAFAELGQKSRLALGKGLCKAATHVGSLEGAEIVAQADKVSSLAKASTTVFGWGQGSGTPTLRLELIAAAGQDNPPELPTIDAETGKVV